MRRIYDCSVHVFEPHPLFSSSLAAQFRNDDKVICHDFALGGKDGELMLSDDADASSALGGKGKHIAGRIRSVQAVMDELHLTEIAVAKINIEGGEYDILPALIALGLIARFGSLAVQFHNYGPGDDQRREAIRTSLEATHNCVWNYDFVWEKWDRKT